MAGPHGGRRGSGYKLQKPRKETINRLLKYFKPVAGKLIFVMIIVTISAVLLVLGPVYLGDIITKATSTDFAVNPYLQLGADGIITVLWPKLMLNFGIIIVFYIVNALIMWLADWIIIGISSEYAYNLRKDIKEKLDRVPLSYYDHTPFGDILSRGKIGRASCRERG